MSFFIYRAAKFHFPPFPTRCRFFIFWAVLFLIKRGYNYNEVQAAVNSLNKKSVTTIAKEVIAGKWGNGSDRKKKLESAGYNYNEVQKEVNRLL